MDKNWLIRTKSNHILGPVSKDKVIELYKNGSIKADDEICSGNGYWFFIREDHLIEKYLIGHESQGFNPISEAKDVLTPGSPNATATGVKDDITLVGNLNLSMLNQEKTEPTPEVPAPAPIKLILPHQEPKKKNNLDSRVKKSVIAQKPLRKQAYLKYLGLIAFIVLFLMVYFRKSIIHSLFQGEITLQSLSLLSSAHAQEVLSEKKKSILDKSVSLDKVIFYPSVGLDGLKVVSQFNIEDIECTDLRSDIYQLAVLLYPPEEINENFLRTLRDCVIKLPMEHSLKKWMKWVGEIRPSTKKESEYQTFLSEIVSSKFNLITDIKTKNRIIEMLSEVPETSLPERLLKSYLYLIIGNVTRSDNLIKDFINKAPIENWSSHDHTKRIFNEFSKSQFELIYTKLSSHPTDRRVFQLLNLYLENFYNDKQLLTVVGQVESGDVDSKLGLKYIQAIAPSFVKYLRYKRMGEQNRIKNLRNLEANPLRFQSYWIWPFLDIDPLVSEHMNSELKRVESEDQLWFIYLMENEKLADVFSLKAGKSFLPGRRPYLKGNLEDPKLFMMSLYKLIELGDIGQDLVLKVTSHLIHE